MALDKTLRFNPWIGKIPWRRAWQPTPAFLPGECNGQWSLAGYSPWGPKRVKGTFHAKMDTIKDKDGKDQIETEEIRKR